MPRVYYVPGLGGTEMYLDSQRTDLLWVDYWALLLEGPERLALAADGITPLPPHGRDLFAGAPLPSHYRTAIAVLAAQLVGFGYEVVPFAYDFRLHPYLAGIHLAERIRADTAAGEKASIVGHSMGGLVARAAWTELSRTQDSGLVRRIVTLGTPHWGSYGGIEFWAEAGSMVKVWSSVVASFTGPLSGLAARKLLGGLADRVIDLLLTWPAIYDLLPLLGVPEADADPFRDHLYGAGQWHGRDGAISPDHLAYAHDVTGPWLRSAESMPTSEVLTVVAGTGFDTFEALENPDRLGLSDALRNTTEGDGTVTVASAIAGRTPAWTLQSRHSDLPVDTSLNGLTARLIREERSPQTPTILAAVPGLTSVPTVNTPPALTYSIVPGPGGCGGGNCSC